jgi:hypothetical protein
MTDRRDITPHGANNFTAYGDAVSARAIAGKLLRFRKGEYLAGEDDECIKPGTLLVANMDELLVGWVKWLDRKPVEHVMGRVAEGFQPPLRRDLGDLDTNAWDEDAAGKAKDPWQLTNYLLCMDDSTQLYTFVTSSRTGLNSIAKLSKAYGRQLNQHVDAWPVVQLSVAAYESADFGRIQYPEFPIVAWVPRKSFPAPDSVDGGGGPSGSPGSAKAKRKPKLQLRPPLSKELDDEIPTSFA